MTQIQKFLWDGRWFSPGTPVSSTTKTGGHDIAESGVKHQKSINQSINHNGSSVRFLLVEIRRKRNT